MSNIRKEDISNAINNCLTDGYIDFLPNFYRGKVRDNYDLADGKRLIITTDRQSAFDHVLASVPFKGQVLTKITKFWLDLTKDICPNHLISMPDPNVMIVKRLQILPIEIVVRDYLTGTTDTSIWVNYQKGKRNFGGITLADNLKKNSKLPKTILTPSTKAEIGAHDIPISEEEILEKNIINKELWYEIKDKAFALFAKGKEIAAKNGLILVDTKYEFGVDENGKLYLADEIHTPDSSRYWWEKTYQERFDNNLDPDMLDKEFLRIWIRYKCDPYKDPIPDIPNDTLIEFSQKYIDLYEVITGEEFVAEKATGKVIDRIIENLKGIV